MLTGPFFVDGDAMTVYITKYLFSAGILEEEADVVHDQVKPAYYVRRRRNGQHLARPHWHETKEAAVARAKKMVAARLKSLKKHMASMLALETQLEKVQ